MLDSTNIQNQNSWKKPGFWWISWKKQSAWWSRVQETALLKSSLCNYKHVYTFVKRAIITTVTGADAVVRQADRRE